MFLRNLQYQQEVFCSLLPSSAMSKNHYQWRGKQGGGGGPRLNAGPNVASAGRHGPRLGWALREPQQERGPRAQVLSTPTPNSLLPEKGVELSSTSATGIRNTSAQKSWALSQTIPSEHQGVCKSGKTPPAPWGRRRPGAGRSPPPRTGPSRVSEAGPDLVRLSIPLRAQRSPQRPASKWWLLYGIWVLCGRPATLGQGAGQCASGGRPGLLTCAALWREAAMAVVSNFTKLSCHSFTARSRGTQGTAVSHPGCCSTAFSCALPWIAA